MPQPAATATVCWLRLFFGKQLTENHCKFDCACIGSDTLAAIVINRHRWTMESIQYFEIPEMPGKKMFRCEKRRASLLASSCSAMWTEGNRKSCDDRYWLCKGCSIGAQHAGVGDSTLSPLYATSTCARCGSGAMRLIGGHVCVSCKNREYEYLKGRNARGNAPITHPTLHQLAIRYRSGGRVKTLRRANVVSTMELVIAALRDEPKQVTFAMLPPQRSPLPQMELFA